MQKKLETPLIFDFIERNRIQHQNLYNVNTLAMFCVILYLKITRDFSLVKVAQQNESVLTTIFMRIFLHVTEDTITSTYWHGWIGMCRRAVFKSCLWDKSDAANHCWIANIRDMRIESPNKSLCKFNAHFSYQDHLSAVSITLPLNPTNFLVFHMHSGRLARASAATIQIRAEAWRWWTSMCSVRLTQLKTMCVVRISLKFFLKFNPKWCCRKLTETLCLDFVGHGLHKANGS